MSALGHRKPIQYSRAEKLKALQYANRATKKAAADWMNVKPENINEWAKELNFVFTKSVFDVTQRVNLKEIRPEDEPDLVMRRRLYAIQSIEDYDTEL